MKRPTNCLLLLLLALPIIIPVSSQDIDENSNAFIKPADQQTMSGPKSMTTPVKTMKRLSTMEFLRKLEKTVRPYSKIIYLFTDSLLRSFKHVSLPCIIQSWVPLIGKCTPLH